MLNKINRKFRILAGILLLNVWIDAFTITRPVCEIRSIANHHASFVLKAATDDDDEEFFRLIRGPAGEQLPRLRPKTVYILSDTTGTTAKAAVEKSLSQFNGCDSRYLIVKDNQHLDKDDNDDDFDDDEECENVITRIYPFVQTEKEIAQILKKAQEKSAFVVFTLADPELRDKTCRMCELSNLSFVDLLGPMFNAMTNFFQRAPLGTPFPNLRPGTRRTLSDDYYRRIEAVEYTLKCDDGMSPHKLIEADVILIGVSRTGKTPLSVYLSQTYALKVANCPLVVDLPPPRQLFDMNPRRVFCLTLDPSDLMAIRKTRLGRELKHATRKQRSAYADWSYLKKDLNNASRIALENNFMEIDVTGRAVEETASMIALILNERFPSL